MYREGERENDRVRAMEGGGRVRVREQSEGTGLLSRCHPGWTWDLTSGVKTGRMCNPPPSRDNLPGGGNTDGTGLLKTNNHNTTNCVSAHGRGGLSF